MTEHIFINPNNTEFFVLMKKLCLAIKDGDTKMSDKIKKEFAKDNISIFYNEKLKEIRLVRKDHPFVDLPISKFQ